MFEDLFKRARSLIKTSRNVSVTGNKARLTIGEKTYTGENITIRDNKIFVDGVEQTGEENSVSYGAVTIQISGDVENVSTNNGAIEVHGNAGAVETSLGNIKVDGMVNGNVKTSQGDVTIGGDIKGDVETSMGDITAQAIHGNCHTNMGDINV